MQKLMIALLLLACFASPVSAGCAWVLYTVFVTGEKSSPQQAWNSKEECESERVKLYAHYEAEAKNPKNPKITLGVIGENILVTAEESKPFMFNLKCLPDTVKP